MSENKLSPEIMEMIEKEWPYVKVSNAESIEINLIQEQSRKDAIFGATIVLTKQWVKVTDSTVFPDGRFIGCEKGSKWVGEVEKIGRLGRIFRVTDEYEADPITLSDWMPLPPTPQD